MPLEPQMVFREVCFYLQAGAHSTANAFTHTINDIFLWAERIETDPATLDKGTIQRCMHESLRLHPASPVAYRTPLDDVELVDGTWLPAGSTVVLDLTTANMDTTVFGDDAAAFDPNRELPRGIAPWGVSFGSGMHACIGAELDGGLDPRLGSDDITHLFGTVTAVAHAFLSAGGQRDPAQGPTLDPNSTRTHFSRYPIVFYDPVGNQGSHHG